MVLDIEKQLEECRKKTKKKTKLLEECRQKTKLLEEREDNLKQQLRRLVDVSNYDVQPLRDQVFLSYSHRDRAWSMRLKTMLAPIIRIGIIDLWDDTMIKPGERWREEIQTALKRANVAVLVVSPDFLASDFITNNELPMLLDSEEIKVVWFPIRASMVDETPIIHYQAAIDSAKPINSMTEPEQDEALLRIARKIAEAFHA